MSKPATPGRCISCKKEISWLSESTVDSVTNLNDAVDFVGTASYGSSWDTVHNLVVYVCDGCIREVGAAGDIHQHGDDGELRVWQPDAPFANADSYYGAAFL